MKALWRAEKSGQAVPSRMEGLLSGQVCSCGMWQILHPVLCVTLKQGLLLKGFMMLMVCIGFMPNVLNSTPMVFLFIQQLVLITF